MCGSKTSKTTPGEFSRRGERVSPDPLTTPPPRSEHDKKTFLFMNNRQKHIDLAQENKINNTF